MMSSITSSICSREVHKEKQDSYQNHRDTGAWPSTSEVPVQLGNPSAVTPAVQAGHSAHGRAEDAWSNPLLPPAVPLHLLPTDTQLLLQQRRRKLPVEKVTLRTPFPLPTAALLPPLHKTGPKPGHRQSTEPWTSAGKEKEQRFAADPQQQNPLDSCPSHIIPAQSWF